MRHVYIFLFSGRLRLLFLFSLETNEDERHNWKARINYRSLFLQLGLIRGGELDAKFEDRLYDFIDDIVNQLTEFCCIVVEALRLYEQFCLILERLA